MAYTLLEMVQRVARKLNSDEVSELDETIESSDIAHEVLDTFEDLMHNTEWEFLKHQPRKLAEKLNGQSVVSLRLPSDVVHIESLMYECQTDATSDRIFREIKYLSPAEFQQMTLGRKLDTNCVEVTVGEFRIRVFNDTPPSYFTSFDEKEIVFDSYNAAIDTTGVVATKTAAIAKVVLLGTYSETWSPSVPEFIYNLWYHEAVARCSSCIRGVEDGRSERMARRAMVTALRYDNAAGPNNADDGVNYGR